MKFERVPKYRRNLDRRPFLLVEDLVDGRTVLFVGWFKFTLRSRRDRTR